MLDVPQTSGREIDGTGRGVFKSGAVYEGAWSAGRMHGQGRISWPDGLTYEGDFHENSITGTGVSSAGAGQQLVQQLLPRQALAAS